MSMLEEIINMLLGTMKDLLPIVVILFGFQFAVIRKPLNNARSVIFGFVYVLVGLSLFLLGLEWCLFPLGRLMAEQLTDPVFIFGVEESKLIADHAVNVDWRAYGWVYVFA